jgi:hypothetical protein
MRTVTVGQSNVQAYFDVRLLDNLSPALSEAGGQPEYQINDGGWNPSGISTLVSVSYGRYSATLSAGIITTLGDVIFTRYKSGSTAESRGDTFLVSDGTTPTDLASIACYGSVPEADFYFSQSLGGKTWKKKSPDEKQRALNDAAKMIDRLNFAGCKSSTAQVLQFPRGTSDVNVPDDIKAASYLIANKLLDGWDADIEADIMAVQSNRYQGASTMYNREYIPEHIRAGIPSAEAWRLIRPYVRDTQEINLIRQ